MSYTSLKYSEEELVGLLQSKSRKAFDALYTNYSDALFGVISKVITDEELAQDILQEVFVKIWDRFESYNASKGRLFTWMLNIARNASIDATRSKQFGKDKKTNSIENSVNIAWNNNSEQSKTDFIGVQKFLDQLRPEYRLLIDMIYFEGYTHAEAAEELELPLGTVKTRVRSAIIELRNNLN